MRCPNCRKAIPDGSTKHPDCGYGYEHSQRPTYHPVYAPMAPAEANAAWKRNRAAMEARLRSRRLSGREVWERILQRFEAGENNICSLAIRYAQEVLGAVEEAKQRREVERELVARGPVTVQREPGED